MKEIWKFTLPAIDKIQLAMPIGAQVLSVCEQQQQIVVVALVSPSEPMSTRNFAVVGTGHTLHDPQRMKFIGTVSLNYGFFMFHVFEEVIGVQAISIKRSIYADDPATVA